MEQIIISYFLGELTEKEQIELEEEYFSDEKKYLQLQAVQNELIDAYMRGKLSEEQRERFEKHFLTSPWRRGRLEFAGALADYVSVPAAAPEKVAPRQWSFLDLFRFQNPLFGLSMALAMLLIIAGASWMVLEIFRLRAELEKAQSRQPVQPQSTERDKQLKELEQRTNQLAEQLEREQNERARLERELEKGPQTGSPVFSLILSPISVRDGGGPTKLSISSTTRIVQAQLNFNSTYEYRTYRAQLETSEGNEKWSRSGLKAQKKGAVKFVVVNIPAEIFTDNDYIIKLSGLTESGDNEDISEYSVRAARR
jgi:hypothetical protein